MPVLIDITSPLLGIKQRVVRFGRTSRDPIPAFADKAARGGGCIVCTMATRDKPEPDSQHYYDTYYYSPCPTYKSKINHKYTHRLYCVVCTQQTESIPYAIVTPTDHMYSEREQFITLIVMRTIIMLQLPTSWAVEPLPLLHLILTVVVNDANVDVEPQRSTFVKLSQPGVSNFDTFS